MKRSRRQVDDPRIAEAVDELTGLILSRFPDAQIAVGQGEDPEGVYLTTTVDVEDPDVVIDLVIERMLALQIDEQLPVYVVPIRPLERVLASLQYEHRPGRALLPSPR